MSTYLLGDGGATTASFNFYSATDTGTALNSISAVSNFTAGVTNVAATVSCQIPLEVFI